MSQCYSYSSKNFAKYFSFHSINFIHIIVYSTRDTKQQQKKRNKTFDEKKKFFLNIILILFGFFLFFCTKTKYACRHYEHDRQSSKSYSIKNSSLTIRGRDELLQVYIVDFRSDYVCLFSLIPNIFISAFSFTFFFLFLFSFFCITML